jgi:hypothetical protein
MTIQIDIKSRLKQLGITGTLLRSKHKTEIRIDKPKSLQGVSENIITLKQEGFYIRLYGQCKPDNLNPESPADMERCDSCYVSKTKYG